MYWCIYAALHILGLIIIWAAVVANCGPTAGLTCALAVVAGAIVSAFVIGSFINAVNRCRARRS